MDFPRISTDFLFLLTTSITFTNMLTSKKLIKFVLALLERFHFLSNGETKAKRIDASYIILIYTQNLHAQNTYNLHHIPRFWPCTNNFLRLLAFLSFSKIFCCDFGECWKSRKHSEKSAALTKVLAILPKRTANLLPFNCTHRDRLRRQNSRKNSRLVIAHAAMKIHELGSFT